METAFSRDNTYTFWSVDFVMVRKCGNLGHLDASTIELKKQKNKKLTRRQDAVCRRSVECEEFMCKWLQWSLNIIEKKNYVHCQYVLSCSLNSGVRIRGSTPPLDYCLPWLTIPPCSRPWPSCTLIYDFSYCCLLHAPSRNGLPRAAE